MHGSQRTTTRIDSLNWMTHLAGAPQEKHGATFQRRTGSLLTNFSFESIRRLFRPMDDASDQRGTRRRRRMAARASYHRTGQRVVPCIVIPNLHGAIRHNVNWKMARDECGARTIDRWSIATKCRNRRAALCDLIRHRRYAHLRRSASAAGIGNW